MLLPGGIEIWVIVVLIVLFFGGKRLPELGTGLGKFIGNFKKSFKESKAIDITPEEKKASPEEKE